MKKKYALTEEEAELIQKFRKLDARGKNTLLELADFELKQAVKGRIKALLDGIKEEKCVYGKDPKRP